MECCVQVRRHRLKGMTKPPFLDGRGASWRDLRCSLERLSIRRFGGQQEGGGVAGTDAGGTLGTIGLGIGDDPQAGGPEVVGVQYARSAADSLVVRVVVLGTEVAPVASAVAGEQVGPGQSWVPPDRLGRLFGAEQGPSLLR